AGGRRRLLSARCLLGHENRALSSPPNLRVWHRWMCAGLPNRTGEIVARGPLQIRGVSLPARISVLQTEEAGSAPARPATVSLLRLFLPLGRSVRRRILNPEQPGSTPGGAASQSRTGDGACRHGPLGTGV